MNPDVKEIYQCLLDCNYTGAKLNRDGTTRVYVDNFMGFYTIKNKITLKHLVKHAPSS